MSILLKCLAALEVLNGDDGLPPRREATVPA